MPTKTEQADLLQAIVGRNGECPIAVVAPATPAECFDIAIEAVRLAIEHMCPVAYLSDGSLANGAEPWHLPDLEDLEPHRRRVPHRPGELRAVPARRAAGARRGRSRERPASSTASAGSRRKTSPATSRTTPRTTSTWCSPARRRSTRSPTGCRPRRSRASRAGDVLIVGWGGTYGALRQATLQLRAEGAAVGHLHLRYLNPLQSNVGELLRRYRRVVVAELNRGQLRSILRDKFLVDARGLNKIQGKPFKVREVVEAVRKLLAPATGARQELPLMSAPSERRRDQEAHEEGLRERPGGALVPGLRRLRDPRADAEGDARARHPEREDRLHLRDRLQLALPVLHGHLRVPHDPRPRAGDRDGPAARAARALGVGRDRRRRRALDRRQPPDPRAAPQRRPEDPALQQQGVRADQGPVLADLRDRHEDEVARRAARSRGRSAPCRSRSAPRRPSSRAASTPRSSTCRR